MSAPTAASFEAEASSADTGSGPEVRVVGVQAWNGTADSLNASPASEDDGGEAGEDPLLGDRPRGRERLAGEGGVAGRRDPQRRAEDEQPEGHERGREQGEGAMGRGPTFAPGDEGDDGQGRELEGDEPRAEVAGGDDGGGAARGREQHDDLDDARPGAPRRRASTARVASSAATWRVLGRGLPSHRQRPSGAGVQSVSRGSVATSPGSAAAAPPASPSAPMTGAASRTRGARASTSEDEDHGGDGEERGQEQGPLTSRGSSAASDERGHGVGRHREDEEGVRRRSRRRRRRARAMTAELDRPRVRGRADRVGRACVDGATASPTQTMRATRSE